MTESSDDRIARLEAELAALRREMQAFAGTVSHDLRAPLRRIVSFTQVVQEDAAAQLSAEVQGFLTTIADSARHMGAMLDGLLELSRVGGVALQMQPVEPKALVQEVCAQVQLQYPDQRIEWQVADTLASLFADPALLRQVLRHVLDNAVKFSGSRTPAVIAVSASSGGNGAGVALTIQDNGAGFDATQQAQLFQPFSRLPNARALRGLGMGLACTRKAMERMGGTVAVVGQADAGCCVSLQFAAAATPPQTWTGAR